MLNSSSLLYFNYYIHKALFIFKIHQKTKLTHHHFPPYDLIQFYWYFTKAAVFNLLRYIWSNSLNGSTSVSIWQDFVPPSFICVCWNLYIHTYRFTHTPLLSHPIHKTHGRIATNKLWHLSIQTIMLQWKILIHFVINLLLVIQWNKNILFLLL